MKMNQKRASIYIGGLFGLLLAAVCLLVNSRLKVKALNQDVALRVMKTIASFVEDRICHDIGRSVDMATSAVRHDIAVRRSRGEDVEMLVEECEELKRKARELGYKFYEIAPPHVVGWRERFNDWRKEWIGPRR